MKETQVELYTPRDYQSVVHSAITEHINTNTKGSEEWRKVWVVKAARQLGKTALVLNEMLRWALEFPNSKNDYVAPTNEQSHKFYVDFIAMSGNLVAKTDQMRHIITMINGSTINCHSAHQKEALRGYTTTGLLVLDECIAIPDLVVYKLIMPWVDAHNACILAISTPLYKTGWFYRLFIKGLDSQNNSTQSFDFMNFDTLNVRSQDRLDEVRSEVPPQVYKSEYLGLFIDAEGSVFGNFEKCLQSNTPEYKEIYLGLDFGTGSGKDYTVITAFNENGEMVDMFRTNQLNPTEQVDKIVEIYTSFQGKVKTFIAEENSIGKIYLSQLKSKGIYVTPFTTTNDSKRKLVESLQVAIQNNEVKFINNQHLITELSVYESVLNTNNKVVYNAPSGYNDDIVMATMLGYEAYKRKTSNSGESMLANLRFI